jgi:hypothetical protein
MTIKVTIITIADAHMRVILKKNHLAILSKVARLAILLVLISLLTNLSIGLYIGKKK